MFCGIKDCKNLAKYLQIIEISKDRRIKFNLCDEHKNIKVKFTKKFEKKSLTEL